MLLRIEARVDGPNLPNTPSCKIDWRLHRNRALRSSLANFGVIKFSPRLELGSFVSLEVRSIVTAGYCVFSQV